MIIAFVCCEFWAHYFHISIKTCCRLWQSIKLILALLKPRRTAETEGCPTLPDSLFGTEMITTPYWGVCKILCRSQRCLFSRFWRAWQSWVIWLPSHPHNLWSAHYVSMLISVSIHYWLSVTTIYRLHGKLQNLSYKMTLTEAAVIWLKRVKTVTLLKGSYNAHFPQVDIILYDLNEKSVTSFG